MYITQQLNNLAMTALQLYIYQPSGECSHKSRRQVSVAETTTCMSTRKGRHNADVIAVRQTAFAERIDHLPSMVAKLA